MKATPGDDSFGFRQNMTKRQLTQAGRVVAARELARGPRTYKKQFILYMLLLTAAVPVSTLGLASSVSEVQSEIVIFAPAIDAPNQFEYRRMSVKLKVDQRLILHIEARWSLGMSIKDTLSGNGLVQVSKLEIPGAGMFNRGSDQYDISYRAVERGENVISIDYSAGNTQFGGTKLDVVVQ